MPLFRFSSSQHGAFYAVSYGAWLTLVYAVVFAIAALGVALEFRNIDENVETLARERGGVLFRLVELTRDWNARHGGVYVPVTEKTQPNPYLKHKRRDLETVDGMRLTMINPAYMTRQIAEIAAAADGVHLHITSLKPIRPANAPDPWEEAALRRFEQGEAEVLELVRDGSEAQHRFMAPLKVKQPCLACHAEQGYKLGDIRGGISVSMPAGKMLAVRDEQRRRVLASFGGAALIIGLLLHLAIRRSRQYFLHLSELSAGQERLIAERTAELSGANEQLRGEVLERQRKEIQISESEARYRSVIETSQDAILITRAPDFAITFANEQASELFGATHEALIGHPLLQFVDAQDRVMVADRQARRMGGEVVSPVARIRFNRPNGSVRVCDAHVARIETQETVQWVLSLRDVTASLESERERMIAAAVMENASEGIIVTDAVHRIIQVNPGFTAISGYRSQEVLGKDLSCLGSGRQDAAFFQSIWQSLASDGYWEGEMWNRRPDGAVYVVWLAISTIRGDGEASGGRHVATMIDITQRKEVEELLRHRAQSDPLTDLPNRNLFYDRLQMALTQSRRYSEEFALLYIDLDRFKAVNDTLGHAAGDQLLVEASHRLTQAVRASDTVARIGGDEFAVILPKVGGQAEVEEISERIVQAIARPFQLDEGVVEVSASVGVAIYPQHGDDLDKIKAAADAALYVVKEGGRNGYRLYQPYCR